MRATRTIPYAVIKIPMVAGESENPVRDVHFTLPSRRDVQSPAECIFYGTTSPFPMDSPSDSAQRTLDLFLGSVVPRSFGGRFSTLDSYDYLIVRIYLIYGFKDLRILWISMYHVLYVKNGRLTLV